MIHITPLTARTKLAAHAHQLENFRECACERCRAYRAMLAAEKKQRTEKQQHARQAQYNALVVDHQKEHAKIMKAIARLDPATARQLLRLTATQI